MYRKEDTVQCNLQQKIIKTLFYENLSHIYLDGNLNILCLNTDTLKVTLGYIHAICN